MRDFLDNIVDGVCVTVIVALVLLVLAGLYDPGQSSPHLYGWDS